MNLKTFYEKFERFADAPGAVAKMRELVLGLAVQGKLTERNSGDQEDADWQDFTQKFDGRIYSYDPGPPPPFEIPDEWHWVCLDDIADYRAAKKVDPKEIPADTWLLDLEEIEKESGRILHFKTFREKASTSTKAHFAVGDVLYGKLRPYLNKVVVAPQPGYCTTEIVPIRSRGIVTPEYLALFLRSPAFVSYANSKSYGMKMPRLGTGDAESAEIPLPPLAEQKRIVAKVDALMALCDQLEAQQAEREAQAAAVQRAARHRFHQAPGPDTVDDLFHSAFNLHLSSKASAKGEPSSLKNSSLTPHPSSLRKSILTLAVQGKLVPQDPAKENAKNELRKIIDVKTSLLSKKEIRKTEAGKPISTSDFNHDIPENWEWVRLVDICELITDGTHQTPKYTETGRTFLSAQNVKPFRFMPENHRFISEAHYQGYIKNRKPERGDILLTRVGAGIGEAATIDQDIDFAIYVSLGLIRPVRKLIFPDYLTLWLNSPDGTAKSSENTYGKGVSQGNLNLGLIRQFLVPLPPLAEQQRIVAKVDQLMRLVDQLEGQLVQSRVTTQKLLDALISELTTSN